MDNTFLTRTISALTKQIDYLKSSGFPGLYQDIASIVNSNDFPEWDDYENCIQTDTLGKFEELSVLLPFAGTNFTVKIYFHLYEPWISPDIILSDSQFMKSITVDDLEDVVTTLGNWEFLSEHILALFLAEIYQLYKRYQLMCLEKEDALFFEYKSLMHDLNIGTEDIETSLTGGSNWQFSMLIRLPLNLEDVPPSLIDANTGTPVCLLHISLKKNNGSITPRLHLSPQLQSLIGDCTSLGLPIVPPGSSLSDYTKGVLVLLEERVKAAVKSFELRKQFISQLLTYYGSSLLEYDSEKFSKASFLFEMKKFHFIIVIEVPEDFQQELPQVTFTSIYHSANQHPIKKELVDISYPPSSSLDDIVKALHNSILKYTPEFQSQTVNKNRN